MLRAVSLSHGGVVDRDSDFVELDFERRHRRRHVLVTARGARVLVDFPSAVLLRDGDALGLDDGGRVVVRARAEELAELRVGDPSGFVRLAYHLGNRHLQAAIAADRMLIRRDPVIEAMAASLGAAVAHVEAPFDPEGGAP
jgi:urease accessory protein